MENYAGDGAGEGAWAGAYAILERAKGAMQIEN